MKKVVKLKKNGKFKITSNEAWLEFVVGLGKDIDGGTLKRCSNDERTRRGGNPCRECCGRGNVEFCGMYVALCTDGTSCVLG